MKNSIITLLVIGGAVYVFQKRNGVIGLASQENNEWFAVGSAEWFGDTTKNERDYAVDWFGDIGQAITRAEPPLTFKGVVENIKEAIAPIVPVVIKDVVSDTIKTVNGETLGGNKSQPRGIRNNNAGNIEYTGSPWQGLDNPPSDGRFMRFKTPEHGLRALGRLLLNYQIKYGLNTVQKLINRWAPTFENNTSAYANAVARHLGVGVSDVISVRENLKLLIEAIVQHENGKQPYTSAQINKSIQMIGI